MSRAPADRRPQPPPGPEGSNGSGLTCVPRITRGLAFAHPCTRSSPGNTGPNRSDRKSTRLNSSHRCISYAVFCFKKKKGRCEAKAEKSADRDKRVTQIEKMLRKNKRGKVENFF